MAERGDGVPSRQTDHQVRNEDWDGRDLSGETHPRMAFIDVDLTETTGAGAAFTDCTFRNCRFNCSRHSDAAFTNCTFANCDLFDVRFTAAKFVGSSFTRCSFNQLTVVGGDWSFVGLAEADLRRASFTGTRMREADLTGARLQGACVRDVDLSGASLDAADLSGCDLRGTDLSAVEPLRTNLTGAIIYLEQTLAIATALGLDVRSREPT